MKLAPFALLAAACAGPDAAPAWNAPAADGPVLCGTVRDRSGRPLADVEVRAYAGFATRFGEACVRTDTQGRYRLHPVPGSYIFREDGTADFYVGVCAGSAASGVNPAEALPWQDVTVPQAPGTVVVLDFVLDPESVPPAVRGG